jgi:type II secretory pathway component PulL
MLTKEEKLAREIASALGDEDSIALHISYAEKYSEEYLRSVLQKVLSIPEDQIRKTRGALFTFLIRQNHGGKRHYRN